MNADKKADVVFFFGRKLEMVIIWKIFNMNDVINWLVDFRCYESDKHESMRFV